LFTALERTGIGTIVFSSSCAVYGEPDQVPITESCPRKPVSVYGMTKKTIEDILRTYAERLNWRVSCLRYFNAAGADPGGDIGESHEPESHAIPLILQCASGKRDSFEIYGTDYGTPDGTCIRDYVHVMDLGRAHCLALETMQTDGRFDVINLGSETGTSVLELLNVAKTITGVNFSVQATSRRAGDAPVLLASSKLARKLLNWVPSYSLDDIVQSAWNWECHRKY
jgi:UDP-glucose 4-epimerase